ncbi:MAG: DUF6198 family protein [Oscillospiraceae bacterium]|nr:DUF6198 family protein [Oscillospiraceae bacterium]
MKQFVSIQNETIRRTARFLVGVCISAVGVAFASKSGLGTTPLSLPAYVLSQVFPLSIGEFLILQHSAFLLAQAILLRRAFRLSSLLQLPLAIVYEKATDLALWCMDGFSADIYAVRLLLCGVGIVVTGCGVCLMVKAKVLVLAGEGLTLAIAQRTGHEFGNVKIAVDCGLVLFSAMLSFSLLGRITGIREGTVASAVLVGMVVRVLQAISSHRAPARARHLLRGCKTTLLSTSARD